MIFDYFYEGHYEKFTFYMLPKAIMKDDLFGELTINAKVLYAMMLDRISLSRENGWIDEDGRIYIFYTVATIKNDLRCSITTASRLLKELDDFGLIERCRKGLCKPNLIYVKDFSRLSKPEFLNSINEQSGIPDLNNPELSKAESNNTDINKTEINETNPIQSEEDKDVNDRNAYLELLSENLEMDALLERYPNEKETLDSILYLLVDVICSKRKTIRIARDDKPFQVVKSQFLKLDSMHIEYVLRCLRDNDSQIKNIKQYMLTTLYNAPITMKSYYRSLVNHDMTNTHKPQN